MNSETETILALVAIPALCWALLVIRQKRHNRTAKKFREQDTTKHSPPQPQPMKTQYVASQHEFVKPFAKDAPWTPGTTTPSGSTSSISSSPTHSIPALLRSLASEEKGYVWE